MTQKSRDLWIHDYFSILQLEYLTYYLRGKIYERQIDKKRYGDICRMKHEKIVKLAYRNGKHSIFDSDGIRKKYLEKFLGDQKGFPNFQYKDAEHERKTGRWDKYYFWKPGVKVKYKDDVYSIVQNIIDSDQIVIVIDGQFFKLPTKEVYRDVTHLMQ